MCIVLCKYNMKKSFPKPFCLLPEGVPGSVLVGQTSAPRGPLQGITFFFPGGLDKLEKGKCPMNIA